MSKQSFIQTVHPNTKEIYQAVDRTIRLNSYRQEDIGKALGIKQSTVSYHLNHCSFDQDQLNDLLDYLGLEIKICVKE